MSAVPARSALPVHVLRLLDALRAPTVTRDWSERDWDIAVRTARLARLLAVLAQRIADAGVLPDLALPVQQQLTGALAESRYLTHMQRVELARVARVLVPLGITPVLLKGAAYVAQTLPIAAGRMPNDVDVLVAPEQLDAAENALRAAGWRFDESLDDYDQRYYRRWSHELPPLRYHGFVLELDLHHAILPPTTRVSPPTALLLPQARTIAGQPFLALSPADQVLHIAAHVFIDSDCTSKLRDLVDLNTLLAHYAGAEPEFMATLADRASVLQLSLALSYALAYVRAWFVHQPDQAEALRRLSDANARAAAPSPTVLALAARTLPPHHPDSEPGTAERWASRLLALRYHLWRMPLPLLAYHTAMKGWRALRAALRREAESDELKRPP
jgi:hypothetical protein